MYSLLKIGTLLRSVPIFFVITQSNDEVFFAELQVKQSKGKNMLPYLHLVMKTSPQAQLRTRKKYQTQTLICPVPLFMILDAYFHLQV